LALVSLNSAATMSDMTRLVAALATFTVGVAFTGWAGISGASGAAILVATATVAAFAGMLANPRATAVVVGVGFLAGMLRSGAGFEAVGIGIYAAFVAAASIKPTERPKPSARHLRLVA
jgi:hypothetical protein